MWDMYESPWLLLTAAFAVLIAVLIARAVFPRKRLAWLIILPVLLTAAGIAIDILNATDHEQIQSSLKYLRRAVIDRDIDTIDAHLHPDYQDAHNRSKAELLEFSRQILNSFRAEKIKPLYREIQITRPTAAAATYEYTVHLAQDPRSELGPPIFFIKLNIYFMKTEQRIWLVTSVEPLEYNREPINWRSF